MSELLAGTPDPRNDLSNRPNRRAIKRAHVQGPFGGAGCRSELALVELRPAADVPAEQRCQRMGCVTAWPKDVSGG